MTETRESLQIRQLFSAPRERVFQAWIEPSQLAAWFRPDTTYTLPVTEVDARPGGQYTLSMRSAEGELYTVTGSYLEVEPPDRLVFTWRWVHVEDDPETLVTVELKELEGATELLLTHERFTTVADRDEHHDGWTRCLVQLHATL